MLTAPFKRKKKKKKKRQHRENKEVHFRLRRLNNTVDDLHLQDNNNYRQTNRNIVH